MGEPLFLRTLVACWHSTLLGVVEPCQKKAGDRGKMKNICLGESPRFISDPGQKAGRKLLLLPKWAVLWGNRGLLPSECTEIRKPQCAIQIPVYLFSDSHKHWSVHKIYYFLFKKIHWHLSESYFFLNRSNTVREPRVSPWTSPGQTLPDQWFEEEF